MILNFKLYGQHRQPSDNRPCNNKTPISSPTRMLHSATDRRNRTRWTAGSKWQVQSRHL